MKPGLHGFLGTRIKPVGHVGHEHKGVPVDWVERSEICIEIPMVGVGASLNVAVAGSLVLYRMAGMA